MHKNAQKVERKTQSKISCRYTWLLHVKNCPSPWRFLRNFLTASKPSRRSITAAKEGKRRKRKAKNKFQKLKSLKTQATFSSKNFDFCACPTHNALKRDAGGKKGKLSCCKRIFDRIKINLAEIQLKNHQNVQKNALLQKAAGVNGSIKPEQICKKLFLE